MSLCPRLSIDHTPRWPAAGVTMLCLLMGALLTRCGTAAEPAEEPVSFEKVVQPLLLSRCGRCHGSEVHKAELSFQSARSIRQGSESGPVFLAGKANESRLIEVLESGEMPPDAKDPLSEDEIGLLRRWIDGGAHFPTTADDAPAVTQHHVLPILLLRCTVCHGGRKQEADLDLRTRASMLRGGKSGPAIVPGDPEKSLLIKKLSAGEMPPKSRLTEAMVKPVEPAELEIISRWIALGAPEAAAVPDLAGLPDDPLVRSADRDFWSFQPPRVPPIPQPRDAALPRNAIDAFILDRLEPLELSLSPEADRATLLRRVAFDLTGLPPTPAEIADFLADTSPDAYERRVERYLASPRYGERWGRHWLDLAGYADCEGRREQHLPRPFAWRYRDYVIRSLNADKPYDRFLHEQIAGDELYDYRHSAEITTEIEDALVATAFLRMTADPTWANLTGFVPDRLEVMADSMDVLGAGILGLSLKCARCHTHKFDPLPQRDYYRLVAIFKGAYDEHDWLKPEVQGFGGALSVGLGDRTLPCVATTERQRWLEQTADLDRQIEELKRGPATAESEARIKALVAQKPGEPRLFALWDRGDPSPTYVYRRGDYLTAGDPVEPGPPAVLCDGAYRFQPRPPTDDGGSTGRRLEFAHWLTQPEHPLTARVMVNRLWHHHFGRGIVRSVGNFGKMGDPPTHPELLDWLAREFVRQGFHLKSLHRWIVCSSTYRQSSIVSPGAVEGDPDNRFLSRAPLRRLDAEQLRDSLLAVAGALDDLRYGPGDPVQVRSDGLVSTGRRRSIYVQQLRKHPATLLETFDLPQMNPNCLARTESLVAPQALYLMNDGSIRELAGKLAERICREHEAIDDRVRQLFTAVLGRPATGEEFETCTRQLAELEVEWRSAAANPGPARSAEQEAFATLCHTLLNSAAFLYID